MTKEPHGVDDGWWEGELDGKFGNFPSLVVEECDENGEPLTEPEDEDDEDGSCPPVHFGMPPIIPASMLPDDITESTSGFEQSEFVPPTESTKPQMSKNNFEIDLTKGLQKQSASQFQAPAGKTFANNLHSTTFIKFYVNSFFTTKSNIIFVMQSTVNVICEKEVLFDSNILP